MLLAIASVCLVALFLYFVILRRRINSISYVMVMSLAVALFVEQVTKLYFGVTSTGVPPLLRGSYDVLGVRVLLKELLLLPVSFVTLGALWAFLRWARTGKAIEAAAQSREGAILVGINPDHVLALTITISAALAGLAGTLVSPLVTVVPSVWIYWLVKAFAIAIVGGLGSLPGAVIAAFLLSFVEIATTFAVSDQFADLVALVIIVAILVIKPSGIMGTRRV
jgi:branched-chain amino acid transport system permease protein